ncbi:MAG: glucose-1-phosphate adenylyltransferase [Nitrospirae bacterium]|nr:glucose-1-phosphate adenylyltransferase [Nitrospirota bacterium]
MNKSKILAFVMAGGEGKRLFPLTAERSKPAVPFGGRYRIVDFVLSNLINSEIHGVYLLVQYKSQSLIEHIRKTWVVSPILSNYFVTVVPPQQMRNELEWFQGTADAVSQNLNLIGNHAPDLVAVFGADHIYRMDIRQMVRFHLERDADITVAALPVPIEEAGAFGIIGADPEGRIREFQEKPRQPRPMATDPTRAYASMGNYLFKTEALVKTLQEASRRGEKDFGAHVLPRLIPTHRLFAYDFGTNRVPGLKSYEEPAYWRDVGTLEAYYDAHQDVLGLGPRLDLFNPKWPIYSSNYQGPVAKILGGNIHNSILGGGSLVNEATVRHSVVRREVILEEGVELENCIIMDNVHIKRGARLRRVIVDRYNTIESNEQIGYDPEADGRRYHTSPSGIVAISRGHVRNTGQYTFRE